VSIAAKLRLCRACTGPDEQTENDAEGEIVEDDTAEDAENESTAHESLVHMPSFPMIGIQEARFGAMTVPVGKRTLLMRRMHQKYASPFQHQARQTIVTVAKISTIAKTL
jgi:hypothetical protein